MSNNPLKNTAYEKNRSCYGYLSQAARIVVLYYSFACSLKSVFCFLDNPHKGFTTETPFFFFYFSTFLLLPIKKSAFFTIPIKAYNKFCFYRQKSLRQRSPLVHEIKQKKLEILTKCGNNRKISAFLQKRRCYIVKLQHATPSNYVFLLSPFFITQ